MNIYTSSTSVYVMATTTTALLSAAGRRLSRPSASTIVWRQVTGHHKLTIDGCAPSTKLPSNWSGTSKTFEAAGYTWQITYRPYRCNSSGDKQMSLYLDLIHQQDGQQQTDPVEFKFSLLDQAGNPVPEYSRSTEICYFNSKSRPRKGFHYFILWKDLEESGCVRDNRFAVQCDITVIKDCAAAVAAPARIVVPPSDLHQHLDNLLWKKQGTDVTGEAMYDAHAWLLAARSPVLGAELQASTKKEKQLAPGVIRRRVIRVDGMEPKVFEVMLRFMYTDALPETKDVVEMAQGLLVEAHRYKLERLKLMCEEMLCKGMDVDTVAGTLALAEQHGCRALKTACMEFIACPGILKAVMETEGFEKIKANFPALLMELVMKQLA